MLRRFIRYYRPERAMFCKDMTASFFVALIGLVYPIVTRRMMNTYIPDRNFSMIFIAGGAVLLLYVVRMLLQYYIQYQGHMMGIRIQAQMRREMFEHPIPAGRLSLYTAESAKSGDLLRIQLCLEQLHGTV